MQVNFHEKLINISHNILFFRITNNLTLIGFKDNIMVLRLQNFSSYVAKRIFSDLSLLFLSFPQYLRFELKELYISTKIQLIKQHLANLIFM